MIDKKKFVELIQSGRFALDEKTSLARGISLSELETSLNGSLGTAQAGHDALSRRWVDFSGDEWILTPTVQMSELTSVSLMRMNIPGEERAQPWDQKLELSRKDVHDFWMQDLFSSATKTFSGGKIQSFYDSNGGFAYIRIDFDQRE